MAAENFAKKKRELFKLLKSEGKLTPESEQAIIDVYGKRGKHAIETIKSGGVVKRGGRWFVRGRVGEYEVVHALCSCRDYVLGIVTGKADVDMCYHALAKTICELFGAHYVSEQRGG